MNIFSIENSLAIYLIICLFVSSKMLSLIPNNYLQEFDSTHRRSSIDGLRGILALSVMTHHFYITYQYKITGVWKAPTYILLENLGGTSVSFFFLITGFLFLNKVSKKNVNWISLYVSRINRIMPLFYVVVAIVFIISLYYEKFISGHYLSTSQIMKWFILWGSFLGTSLGDFKSWIVIAGVNWSLIYEWGFYFSLPLIYMLIQRRQPPIWIILISFIVTTLLVILTRKNLINYILFILAYLPIVGEKNIKNLLNNKFKFIYNPIIIALIIFTYLYTKNYTLVQFFLLGIIFSFIANGYSFHNILLNKGLSILGDISYSIYLLHGIILYIFFTIVKVYDFNDGLQGYYAYYPIIFVITILTSLLSYIYIEKPFIRNKFLKI